jgi:hypothetical protein
MKGGRSKKAIGRKGDSGEGSGAGNSARTKMRRRLPIVVAVLILTMVGAWGAGSAGLPWILRDYVNGALDKNLRYAGRIGKVQVHLWRGAYSVQDVRISKISGNVPVPFFTAERVDFAIQWRGLINRRLVGQMHLERPELNFVDAPDGGQTGADGAWLQMIQDLFPFTINRAVVSDGSIHFRAFKEKAPVDVYLSEVDATIDNLSNIHDDTNPLVATVQAKGLAMDQADFEFKMTLDPSSYRPTFHLATRILGLDVTAINDLALAYGKFDFKSGWLDFVLEMEAKEGRLVGYAKPLFRDLEVFSLEEDLEGGNPIQFLWQALLGATTAVLENPPRDQFGTLIPFSGDLSGTTTAEILATVANVLRNAFVRAYLPRLEPGTQMPDELEFEEAEFIDALATGDSP